MAPVYTFITLLFMLSAVIVLLSLCRTSTKERSGGAVMRKLDPSGKLSRSNLTRRATNLSNTLGGWANTAVNTIRKPN